MSVEVFVDTNILYYALTMGADPRHVQAKDKLKQLWNEPGSASLSVQVLQELHVNLQRKAKLLPSQSWDLIQPYLAWPVVDNDRALLNLGYELQVRWKLSFWDSLILAAAQRCGATTLWSEDLSTTQRYGDIRVVNPLDS